MTASVENVVELDYWSMHIHQISADLKPSHPDELDPRTFENLEDESLNRFTLETLLKEEKHNRQFFAGLDAGRYEIRQQRQSAAKDETHTVFLDVNIKNENYFHAFGYQIAHAFKVEVFKSELSDEDVSLKVYEAIGSTEEAVVKRDANLNSFNTVISHIFGLGNGIATGGVLIGIGLTLLALGLYAPAMIGLGSVIAIGQVVSAYKRTNSIPYSLLTGAVIAGAMVPIILFPGPGLLITGLLMAASTYRVNYRIAKAENKAALGRLFSKNKLVSGMYEFNEKDKDGNYEKFSASRRRAFNLSIPGSLVVGLATGMIIYSPIMAIAPAVLLASPAFVPIVTTLCALVSIGMFLIMLNSVNSLFKQRNIGARIKKYIKDIHNLDNTEEYSENLKSWQKQVMRVLRYSVIAISLVLSVIGLFFTLKAGADGLIHFFNITDKMSKKFTSVVMIGFSAMAEIPFVLRSAITFIGKLFKPKESEENDTAPQPEARPSRWHWPSWTDIKKDIFKLCTGVNGIGNGGIATWGAIAPGPNGFTGSAGAAEIAGLSGTVNSIAAASLGDDEPGLNVFLKVPTGLHSAYDSSSPSEISETTVASSTVEAAEQVVTVAAATTH